MLVIITSTARTIKIVTAVSRRMDMTESNYCGWRHFIAEGSVFDGYGLPPRTRSETD